MSSRIIRSRIYSGYFESKNVEEILKRLKKFHSVFEDYQISNYQRVETRLRAEGPTSSDVRLYVESPDSKCLDKVTGRQ